MKQICALETCYGCCACFNICPKRAISMGKDVYGNTIPVIEQERCVDCGLCQSVCPSLKPTEFVTPIATYAAVCKDAYDYCTATSGGVATTFSRKIIENGGIVYGAAFQEEYQLRHIRVSTIEELEKLKGSKYTQSMTGDSFKTAKADLESGKRVLYIGTSCQIDGLSNFLKKKL